MVTLEYLKRLTDAELAKLDLAGLNLGCATGLPGAEGIDIAASLRTLDQWAGHMRAETQRHWYRFLQAPEEYENSVGYFSILMMISVLQQDCGVRYNPKRIHEPDFTDSRDLFVHGMMGGEGGTCASMPVLYVAVGRRLGYPLKLVHAKAHAFARWDDPEGKQGFPPDRFNIEGTNRGLTCHSDDEYKSWPLPMSERDLAHGCYLKSLTPREELASFYASRGHCLLDNRRLAEAVTAYEAAVVLAPNDPHYVTFLCVAAAMNGAPVPPGYEHFAELAEQELKRINAGQPRSVSLAKGLNDV